MNNDMQHQVVPSADEPCHSRQFHDDEIDLLDLMRILVRQWRWIFASTLIFTAIAVAYALFAPRVYKAEAFLLPPTFTDIGQLNIPAVEAKLSVADVYAETVNNLQSLSLRRRFFKEHNLLELLRVEIGEDVSEQEVFVKSFHKKLNVVRVKKDGVDFVVVSFEGTDPEQITSWLNTFISMVNAYTIDGFVKDVQKKILDKKKSIAHKIQVLRNSEKKRRLDRIAVLQEAHYIANQLGFVQRSDVSRLSSSNHKNSPEVSVVVNTVETPLYLRGTRELQAEIDMLQKRKSDDPFIESLREMQGWMSNVEEIELVTDGVNAVRIDQLAMVPKHPIKPKRKLVVALGALLGLMLGVFAAFFVNFIETTRQKKSEA